MYVSLRLVYEGMKIVDFVGGGVGCASHPSRSVCALPCFLQLQL